MSGLIKNRLCHDQHPLVGPLARCPGNICLPSPAPADLLGARHDGPDLTGDLTDYEPHAKDGGPRGD